VGRGNAAEQGLKWRASGGLLRERVPTRGGDFCEGGECGINFSFLNEGKGRGGAQREQGEIGGACHLMCDLLEVQERGGHRVKRRILRLPDLQNRLIRGVVNGMGNERA